MSQQTPLDAYFNFFSSFNTRDAWRFSSALHYPHVRLTWRTEPVIYADTEAHALQTSWERFIEAGWDHTEGMKPAVIQSSDIKYHIQGGWNRIKPSGEPLLTNRVTYVVTKIDEIWGIQCRYGTDPQPQSEKILEVPNATDVVRNWITAQAEGEVESAQAVCDDVIYEIGVGAVNKITEGSSVTIEPLVDATTRFVQGVAEAQTIAVSSSTRDALLYLVLKHDDWKIKAISWV